MRWTLAAFSLAAAVLVDGALWPAPRHLSQGDGLARVDVRGLEIKLEHDVPHDVHDAIEYIRRQLTSDKFSPLAGTPSHLAAALDDAPVLSVLRLHVQEPLRELEYHVNAPYEHAEARDESYELSIQYDDNDALGSQGSAAHDQVLLSGNASATDEISAMVSANTSLGLLRGLQSFVQLVYHHSRSDVDAGGAHYITGLPLSIRDRPEYTHRGFMLDTARNYFPVADLERTLEAMSWAKLNVFHWHITESQSWPLALERFPELAKHGAYSSSAVYTSHDIAGLVSFATSLGVSIMLEVDMPGHTASIAQSHPEHVACADKEPWEAYGVQPPPGQLRVRSKATAQFARDVTRDAARLTPAPLFSTGGDEVNMRCLEEEEQGGAGDIEQFVLGLHGTLREERKTPVVWQEMVLDHHVKLQHDTIVMVWISSEHTAKVLEQGYRVVHAPADYFYLDCGAGGWVAGGPETSWCEPFKTWERIYSFDPTANVTAEQQHLVMGGQTLLWSEQSDPSNLDPFSWPRAAAAAEVFWTGAKHGIGQARSAKEALPRLHEWRFRAVERGVKAIPLQPEWCARHPGKCVAA